MKLRALVVLLVVVVLGVFGAASCGSEADSVFDDPNLSAEAGGPDPPPFVNNNGDGGTTSCTKLTCADLKINCGPAGDGCGGILEDCGKCAPPQTCGGGGTPSTCGGNQGCIPKTCQQLGIECGPAGDGCGGTLQCGQCQAPNICGGAGPSKCGGGQVLPDGGQLLPDGGTCQPKTQCSPGQCGPIADGCGGLLTCPACGAGESCGGGGTPSVCGKPACVKQTCVGAGATCGFIADGCGGIVDCGGAAACPAGFTCGLGGPNKCGANPDAGVPCVNYCLDQKTCPVGQATKVTGVVYAPNGTLPLPGALVYVPNGAKTHPYGTTAFTDGVAAGTCEQCSTQASGPPLVSTTSAADGSFTLENIPAGVTFPLVIQLGRWRRLVEIPAVTQCTSVALTANQTRLPRTQNEGNNRDNIPLVAISTGRVDGLECVFRKLGIADNQFTNPNGNGRIRLYQDEFDYFPNANPPRFAAGGARINGSTPFTQDALVDTQAHLDAYDAVIFGCPGDRNDRSNAQLDRVRAYANKGGRVFATHFSYVWLYNRTPWNGTITWDIANARGSGNVGDPNTPNPTWPGEIDTTPGKRLLFSQWLAVPAVNALTGTSPPRITITEARNNADLPITAGADSWITKYDDPAGNGKAVLHYTFNTPWGAAAANQCGRVLFSDFHVSIGNTYNVTFPGECNSNALTSQEKVLAFMLFDLTSCIQPNNPPPPPTCTALTCNDQNIKCGPAGNGCGGQIDCGPCPAGQVCQGSPAQCVTPPCTPGVCAAGQCGTIPNGCGGTVVCPPCAPGETCGASGPNKCGIGTCTKTTCEAQGVKCGPAGDGCGGVLDCGQCPPGQTCGGGGVPNECGAPNCTKLTCAQANGKCGPVADGCGGLIDCPCPPGQTCGAGGPNICGTVVGPK